MPCLFIKPEVKKSDTTVMITATNETCIQGDQVKIAIRWGKE